MTSKELSNAGVMTVAPAPLPEKKGKGWKFWLGIALAGVAAAGVGTYMYNSKKTINKMLTDMKHLKTRIDSLEEIEVVEVYPGYFMLKHL